MKNRKDKWWYVGKTRIHYIRYRSTYSSADSHWGILFYGPPRNASGGFGVDFNVGRTVFVWQFSR